MKKDPVLWVVVDRFDFMYGPPRREKDVAESERKRLDFEWSYLAPFRVVKYLPAPKTKRKRKA